MTTFREWASTLPPGAGRVRVTPGDIAEIILDDPRTRNALSPRMMVELADAVDAVAAARVVLLRGDHGTFCSGGNLADVRAHLARPGVGRQMGTFMQATLHRLATSDAVVVGVLDGAAMGGGAELLAACDRVFAAPSARVGWVQARLAVSPGFGGGARLVARVGAARALEHLLGGPVPASEAGALVDALSVDPLAAARAWAEEVARLDPAAARGAVRIVRAARAIDPRVAEVELEVFDALWGAPAHLAALDRR